MIDLHIHTTCSDGQFTPEETMRLAAEAGVTVAAVTDSLRVRTNGCAFHSKRLQKLFRRIVGKFFARSLLKHSA